MKPVRSIDCRLRPHLPGRDRRLPPSLPRAQPEPAKGAAISTAVCAACHSNDGSRGSAASPIMQGQHPDYLVKQLAEFKTGQARQRHHDARSLSR